VAADRPEVAWEYVGTDAERRRATGVLAVLWAVALARWALVVGALAALVSLGGLMAYGLWIAEDTGGSMPGWWDRAVLGAAVVGLLLGAVASLFVIPFRRWRFERRVLEECGAEPLVGPDAELVAGLMDGLAIAAGCEIPRVLRCPSSALNALAVGTDVDDAALVLTEGMLLLPRRQLEAVLAYELGLIAGGEVRLTTWIVILTNGWDLSWMRLGLRAWALRTSALHRDRVAVSFTRDPGPLADAFAAVAADPGVPEGFVVEDAPVWLEFPDGAGSPYTRRFYDDIRDAMALDRRIAALDAATVEG
jgi:Zn-dependent protease with chaperone function